MASIQNNATIIDEFEVQELSDQPEMNFFSAKYAGDAQNYLKERSGGNHCTATSSACIENIVKSSAIFYEEPEEEYKFNITNNSATTKGKLKRSKPDSDDDYDDLFGSSMESSEDELESQEYPEANVNTNRVDEEDEDFILLDHVQKRTKRDPTKPARGCKDELWMWKYNLLKEYKKKYGTTRVRKKNGPLDEMKMLMKWIDFQRASYKRGNVPNWRIKLMDELEFEWTVPTNGGSIGAPDKIAKDPEKQWMKRYKELKEAVQQDGILGVKLNALESWINRQRLKYQEGLLAAKKIKLLQELGYDMNVWKAGKTKRL